MSECLRDSELALSRRTIVLDFDGTICPLGGLGPEGEFSLAGIDPEPGALEGIQRLVSAGFRIVVCSSRNFAGYGERRYTWLNEMCNWLASNGFASYVEVDPGASGKTPAACYVDDKAIRFAPGEWGAIVDWLLFSREQE